MRGTEILERTREELKNFIVYEGKYIYNLTHELCPNWENGEDWAVEFNPSLVVTLSVFDDWDTTIDEKFVLNSIHISLDDNLFFWDADNEEHHYGELKIDELADIANILEEKVKSLLKK